jgi:hypothetical protein
MSKWQQLCIGEYAKDTKIPRTEKWYDHRAEPVLDTEEYKLLWDFAIQTDKEIESRRPDIVFVDKNDSSCTVIDIAVPGDCRVASKESQKIEKYHDIAREIRRLWKVDVTVIPVVVGELGTVSTKLQAYIALLGGLSFETIQKASLLGSARIL